MWYVLLTILGFAVGGGLSFGLMYPAMRRAKADQARFQRLRHELDDEWDRLEAKRGKVQNEQQRVDRKVDEYNWSLQTLRAEEQSHARLVADFKLRQQEWEAKLRTQQQALATRERNHNNNVIAYDELARENQFLKSEVKNLAVHASYLEHQRQNARNGQLSAAVQRDQLGRAYFDEVVAAAKKMMTTSNLSQNNQRVQTAAKRLRAVGVELTPAEEKMALDALRWQFEKAERVQEGREQVAQRREEDRRQQEIEAAEEEARLAEQQRAAVEAELARARAEAARQIAEAMGRENEELASQHAATIQTLQTKLAEAEAQSQRAISNAQLTRKGCVYVISNIGSFGEGVYKIGMTRRHDPMDRVYELGGASVPFPFDVHMQIQCDDAPTLENALHREFNHRRVNRVNLRKEFFRVSLDEIVSAAERHHGTVEFTTDAEASQFRRSQLATDSDLDVNDDTFEEDDEPPDDE